MTGVESRVPGHPAAPLKRLAWEGVGLHAPPWWDVVRYRGDHLFGGFDVGDGERVPVSVAWWKTRGAIDLERELSRRLALEDGRTEPWPTLHGRAVTTRIAMRQVAVLWQSGCRERAALWRIAIEAGEPDAATIDRMLKGLSLASVDSWRDWAALDFSLASPPRFVRVSSSLSAGISHITFARGRQRLTFRRLSTADAVLATDVTPEHALERWLKSAFPDAFFDQRYRVTPLSDAGGRVGLRLRSSRRLTAPLEWKGLFPHFRRSPQRIDAIWDRGCNKIWCFEAYRDREADSALIESFMGSLATQSHASVAAPRRGLMRAMVRLNGEVSSGRTERGLVEVSYTRRRHSGLRLLRAMSAQRAAAEQVMNVELDRIGSALWEACADEACIGELVDLLVDRFQVSHHEARLSVTHYLHALAERGLLTVEAGNRGEP